QISKMATSVNKVDVSDFLLEEYKACMLCNAFYGPNFGQPVCSSCHYFIYPEDVNIPEDNCFLMQKTDSGDSGNEEPKGEEDFYESEEKRNLGSQPSHYASSPKTDKLVDRIKSLTVYQEQNKCNVPDGLVDSIPPEVLLSVFKYLDDISLWTAGNVCSRWRQLLSGETTDEKWQHFISLRWPLFRPFYKVTSWKSVYTKLLESAPCRHCLESMMLQSTPPIEENSWRHRRLRSELKTLKTDPPEGIQATPLDRHCCHWQASITGPEGSAYQGGLFYLYLQIPHSYPMRPPVVRFLTKIFHPNVSRHGDIGLDSIYHNWSLALTISKVLISVQSLLTDPYCNVCMESSVARLYKEDYKEYSRIARLWTWKYAMHDFIRPHHVTLTGS
ncbi:unnamed protein product, partial [Owenia fusiformis]